MHFQQDVGLIGLFACCGPGYPSHTCGKPNCYSQLRKLLESMLVDRVGPLGKNLPIFWVANIPLQDSKTLTYPKAKGIVSKHCGVFCRMAMQPERC